MQTRHHLRTALHLLTFSLAATTAIAQQVAQPEPEQPAATGAATVPVTTSGTLATTGTSDEVVQMSVFNVQSQKDVGYTSFNTTAGSRLNTALRDTAATVTPFTEEMLDDIGATTLQDVLNYAGNVEGEYEDSAGFNDSASRWATTTDTRFRIRGMTAAVMQDYAETAIPYDRYNSDRMEIASGPNAILYGMGAPGGVVLYYAKHANLERNTLTIQNRVGTFDDFSTLPQERITMDWNIQLMPRKLAFRFNALYQNNDNWRKYTFTDRKRIAPALTYRPFKNTTINLNYERGFDNGSAQLNWPAYDSISGWLASGSPTFNPFSDVAPAGVAPVNGAVGTDHYVFDENDGTVNNYRQAYMSTDIRGQTGRTAGNTLLVSSTLMPYNINTTGPGSTRKQNFQDWTANIQQHVGPFDLEFVYTHNDDTVNVLTASGADNRSSGLAADPNTFIAQAIGGSLSAAAFTASSKVPNPRAGDLYMEEQWFKDYYREINDVVHLTAATQFDLGKMWGRHRLTFLIERSRHEERKIQSNEIWADQNNITINTSYNFDANGNLNSITSLTPEGDQNSVWRRHYLTPGNYNTYYAGDGRIPAPTFSAGDRTYHATFANRTNANYHNTTHTTSLALAWQGFWLNNKLATTAGGRLDNVTFVEEGQSRIMNPYDPRVVSGRNVLGEMVFDGTKLPTLNYHPYTYTLGAVYHITDRISPFINYANNVALPNLDLNVLPYGRIGPLTKGRTFEQGLRFDILNDNRYILSIDHFDTSQLGYASINPASINSIDAQQLGASNLQTILTNINDDLLAAGAITQDQHDKALDFHYNGGMADVVSKGWEINLNANPTKAITLQAKFSYTDRVRTNMCGEVYDFYANMIPQWDADLATITDPTVKAQLLNTINGELFNNGTTGANASLIGKMMLHGWWASYQMAMQTLPDGTQVPKVTPQGIMIPAGYTSISNPTGGSRVKFNVLARYKFLNGMLKGFSASLGARFQSAPVIGYTAYYDITNFPYEYHTTGQSTAYGNSTLFWDAMVSYKRKIFGGRCTMTIQVNCTNIFNSDVVTLGRWVADDTLGADGGAAHRVYLNPPRQISLTTTFAF